MPPPEKADISLSELLPELLDPDWYLARYPDLAAAAIDPLEHFTRYGMAEKRDLNPFFDNAWYIEHYPDVAASGMHPLVHYVQAGAAELRNPHPRFDAVYYVDQHPDAAANPLLYHLRTGQQRGYLTEPSFDIREYLPSEDAPLPLAVRVFTDVIVLIQSDLESTRRCIHAVMADRNFPLARIIVVDDHAAEPALTEWLRHQAAEGQIHLIRNRRRIGFAAAVALGTDIAETHDVVLLSSAALVPQGWLRRLVAQAYARPDIATVSPLSSTDADLGLFAAEPSQADDVCQTVNAGRSGVTLDPEYHCIYIRRAALDIEPFNANAPMYTGFCRRITGVGWQHRVACDTFVQVDMPASKQTSGHGIKISHATPVSVIPFCFAATATLLRESTLPVILMVTHNFGGGVRRHIDSLVHRYRGTAHALLLQSSDRGATLSIPAAPNHPAVILPSNRLDDFVTILRSMNVCRVHIHHLLGMDTDIRTVIHRLAVPFDVTVHDYFAICPQINLLRWPEGIYCGEPGPADCNACIADQSSHGARDIVSWRRGWAWQFIDADRVICPSMDVKARLQRHGLAARAVVVPHELQPDACWQYHLPAQLSRPLRIVLLGVLANHKGARAVAEVAEAAGLGTIELHLVGHLEASFPKQAVRLIKVTGKYQDHALTDILRSIDPHVFWFPSSAPETYSFTLSTAIATGRPIVATDFGSFKERLAGRPLTWLVDHRPSGEQWLEAFKAVEAALDNRRRPPPVPRPVATDDFYSDQYLSPMLKSRPDRCPGRKPRARKTQMRTETLKVAIIPERYDTDGLTPCAYIRLLQPFDHLASEHRLDVILADTKTIFDCDANIIVTQRNAVGDPGTADRLADHAQRCGAKLLFDLDDDLLNVPASHPDASKLRPLVKAVRRMLAVADTVWVSTAALAERLAPIRPDAVVMENRLDERIWQHVPAPAAFLDDPIRILCMGTGTHEHDFTMIEPALLRLKAEYGDRVVIDILGMTNRSELATTLNRIGPPTHASRSYPGFVNWLTSMQPSWHIGLAPLLETPFNRGKSPIKAMDYAAMGLAVVASDTPVYRGSLANGPGGQLVANDHRAWYAGLDWLIRDHDLRRNTAMHARQAFLTRATLASHRSVRWAALQDALHPACEAARLS